MKGALTSLALVAMVLSGCAETEIDFVTPTSSAPRVATTTTIANATLLVVDLDADPEGTSARIFWNITGSPKVQSRVEYGPTQALGTNSGYRFGPGAQQILLTGLDPGATYFWRIHAVDGAGIQDAPIRTFTAGAALDTLPPSLSGVQVTAVSHNSARIHWSVSEDSGVATSSVSYGTQSGTYGNTSAAQEGTASMSIQLSQLSPGTTYYFVVRARDTAGNVAQSPVQSFKTLEQADTAAPTISGVQAGTPTSNSVTVSWTVGDDSGAVTSLVEYGSAAGSYASQSSVQSGAGAQTVTLSGLAGSTTYHFRIHAVDGSGNPANSADQTFTTAAAANPAPSLSGTSIGQVGQTSATATWTVQDSTGTITSWVKWGTAVGSYTLGTSTIYQNTGTKSHPITGLTAGTTYHAKMYASDGTTEVESADYPFTTTAAAQPPDVTNVQITAVKKDGFTVSWTVTGPSDVTSRVVYGSGSLGAVQQGTGPQTFPVTGLTEAMAYSVKVRASASGFADEESTPQTQYTADELVFSIVADSGPNAYSPTSRTASSATPLILKVTNNAGTGHSLTVTTALDADPIGVGATVTTNSAILPAQTYNFYCKYHGTMTGTLTVT